MAVRPAQSCSFLPLITPGATGTSVTFWNPDYDKECAPALAKIAREAGQEVPEWLAKFEKAKANKAWAVDKASEALATLKEAQ